MPEDEKPPEPVVQYPPPSPNSGLPPDFYEKLAKTGDLAQAMGKDQPKPS